MDQFKQYVENRHAYAQAWKARTGGKVVGWYEPYFPEELAYAAGMLPVRLLARHEPDNTSEKWMYAACYPARDILNQFLKGRYDYVDAVVTVEGCQWMYHAFESTLRNKPELLNHYLFLPDYTDAPTSKDVLRSELNILKEKFEAWSGSTITDAALDRAIEVYNRNRLLLRQIYELRRAQRPVILGAEMMNLILADQVMDKAEMNGILEQFITELENREPHKDCIRLMLLGSETSDTRLEELVEELGANIVVDELDTGSSYFWNNVIPQKDRLMALALRYLGRPHNPIKDNNWRRRPQHIFELFEDFSADGVIIAKQIYCHLHGTDNYAVWKLLRERNIPFLFFERDTTLPETETKLRLESFIAIVKQGATHLAGWHKVLE